MTGLIFCIKKQFNYVTRSTRISVVCHQFFFFFFFLKQRPGAALARQSTTAVPVKVGFKPCSSRVPEAFRFWFAAWRETNLVVTGEPILAPKTMAKLQRCRSLVPLQNGFSACFPQAHGVLFQQGFLIPWHILNPVWKLLNEEMSWEDAGMESLREGPWCHLATGQLWNGLGIDTFH